MASKPKTFKIDQRVFVNINLFTLLVLDKKPLYIYEKLDKAYSDDAHSNSTVKDG